ncbi:MAG: M20/M25/M40 family metallo-hydrolase [Butyricicoccus sp.]
MSQTLTITAEQVLASAERIREDIVRDRRTLHAAPEVGTDLPNTVACVKKRLLEMGYQPRELAGGVVAEITGTETGRCLLLRADMDALRVTEQTDWICIRERCMHACGHDMHAAMLLGAAKRCASTKMS